MLSIFNKLLDLHNAEKAAYVKDFSSDEVTFCIHWVYLCLNGPMSSNHSYISHRRLLCLPICTKLEY